MKRNYAIRLFPVAALAGCLVAGQTARAQTPAAGDAAASGQAKPAATQPQAGPQSSSNAFPEDTSTVPVLPSRVAPVLPEGTYTGTDAGTDASGIRLPGEDRDPVRSPDDPAPDAGSGEQGDSSSSLAGLDKVLLPPDDDQPRGKRKLKVEEPEHKETATEDINVGGYYLERKNWKAALSRFQSAMVLDPENPEVFWGLAEAERHLGDFWEARGYYETVVDFDPDSKHGKEAQKALKEPEVANAKKAASEQTVGETPK